MLHTVFISKGQYGPASDVIRLDGMSCGDAMQLARLIPVHSHGKAEVILRPELE